MKVLWLALVLSLFLIGGCYCSHYDDLNDNVTAIYQKYRKGLISEDEMEDEIDDALNHYYDAAYASDYEGPGVSNRPGRGLGLGAPPAAEPPPPGPASCSNGTCSADSAYDDDYYYDEPADKTYMYDNCIVDSKGRPKVNGTNTCDLLVTGIDRHADLLTGGLDGLYRLVSCFDGKPWYRRLAGPPGEPRSLFYNEFYGDWQFSSSEEPSEDHLLVYGDFGYVHALHVPQWHLAAALNSMEVQLMEAEDEDMYYIIPGVRVECDPAELGKAAGGRRAGISPAASNAVYGDSQAAAAAAAAAEAAAEAEAATAEAARAEGAEATTTARGAAAAAEAAAEAGVELSVDIGAENSKQGDLEGAVHDLEEQRMMRAAREALKRRMEGLAVGAGAAAGARAGRAGQKPGGKGRPIAQHQQQARPPPQRQRQRQATH